MVAFHVLNVIAKKTQLCVLLLEIRPTDLERGLIWFKYAQDFIGNYL